MMAKGGKYEDLRKRFEGYTDEELQIFNGDNKETLKFWNRKDAIEDAIQQSILDEQGMMKKGGDVQGKQTDKAKDGQRFAKPKGWRWKDEAIKKVGKVKMSKSPSKFMRKKYPDLVYWEDRIDKSDKNPSRKYTSN